MARPWFRFYRKTVNNPKAQRLRPELFKAWVNILCATDDNGNLPALNDLAFTLRVAEAKAREWVTALTDARLIADGAAHDWSEHNYDSDGDPTARERKRKSRAMSRVTSEDGHAKVTRTDTDTELEQKKATNVALPKKRGTRWGSGEIVSDFWITDGHLQRNSSDLPRIDLDIEAKRFANYWSAKSGAGATKLDWHRTWINWCLNAKGNSNGTGFNGRNSQIRGPSARDKLLAEIRETEDVSAD